MYDLYHLERYSRDRLREAEGETRRTALLRQVARPSGLEAVQARLERLRVRLGLGLIDLGTRLAPRFPMEECIEECRC